MANNMHARVKAVTGSYGATVLLLRIIAMDKQKKGGAVLDDGFRYSWRSVAGWAEEIESSLRSTKRFLTLLADANLIVRTMAWAGKGEMRSYILHVRPTSRALAIVNGDDSEMALEEGQEWPEGSTTLGTTPGPKTALPNIDPETYLETIPENPPFAPSGDEPSPSAPAGKNAGEDSKSEEQVKAKIEKGKKSVKDLLNETWKKKILKPDSTSALCDTWTNALIEWNAENGKSEFLAGLSGEEVGVLKGFKKAMGDLDALEAITFAVKHWKLIRGKHIDANAGEKPSVNPTLKDLWTMRQTIGIQLHSSKTPKKQEAVASPVPLTQLTATPSTSAPEPPPKKIPASPEYIAALKAKTKAMKASQ